MTCTECRPHRFRRMHRRCTPQASKRHTTDKKNLRSQSFRRTLRKSIPWGNCRMQYRPHRTNLWFQNRRSSLPGSKNRAHTRRFPCMAGTSRPPASYLGISSCRKSICKPGNINIPEPVSTVFPTHAQRDYCRQTRKHIAENTHTPGIAITACSAWFTNVVRPAIAMALCGVEKLSDRAISCRCARLARIVDFEGALAFCSVPEVSERTSAIQCAGHTSVIGGSTSRTGSSIKVPVIAWSNMQEQQNST